MDYFQMKAIAGNGGCSHEHSGVRWSVIGANGFRFPAVVDDFGSLVPVPPFSCGLAKLRQRAETL